LLTLGVSSNYAPSKYAPEKDMSKQQFAGFLAALTVTAAQFLVFEAGSAITPESRGNPAVTDEAYKDNRLAMPVSAARLRHAVA
jgi:hypothetical protein